MRVRVLKQEAGFFYLEEACIVTLSMFRPGHVQASKAGI